MENNDTPDYKLACETHLKTIQTQTRIIGNYQKKQAAQEQAKPSDESALRDAVITGLVGMLGCGRVWSAWGVGAMTEDDFYSAAESDECIDQIMDEIRPFFAAHPPASPSAPERSGESGGESMDIFVSQLQVGDMVMYGGKYRKCLSVEHSFARTAYRLEGVNDICDYSNICKEQILARPAPAASSSAAPSEACIVEGSEGRALCVDSCAKIGRCTWKAAPAPTVAAPINVWTITRNHDLGAVKDAAGSLIAQTYYNDAKVLTDRHNAALAALSDTGTCAECGKKASDGWALYCVQCLAAPTGASQSAGLTDAVRLNWLEHAMATNHPSTPYCDELGNFGYPYLVNGSPMGGGVGFHNCGASLRAAIDAASLSGVTPTKEAT